ncbi:MAG: FAD-binding protein [Treponema sp.]|nr:FAD-binding protein [Treponema sp.]
MRTLLKPAKLSLLLVVLLAGALALTGCPGNNNGGGQRFVADYDIIVVGAGASGMPAALAAADALGPGGRVLLIEAAGSVGGGLAMAGGSAIAGILNANQDGDMPLTWGQNWANGGAHATYANNQFPTTANVPNWNKLTRVAAYANFVRRVTNGEDSPFDRWGITQNAARTGFAAVVAGGDTAGPAGAEWLRRAIEANNNITLMVNTRGYSLLFGEGNTVTGVTAYNTLNPSQTFSFTAEKVILATGGFLANNQLMHDRLDWTSTWLAGANMGNHINPPGMRDLLYADWYRGNVPRFHDGRGMEMAVSAGAAWTDLWKPGLAQNHGQFDVNFANALPGDIAAAFRGDGHFGGAALGLQIQNAILVDGNGRRFVNENTAISFAWNTTFGLAMMNNATPPFHVIFTSEPRVSSAATGSIDLVAALQTASNMAGWDEVLMHNDLTGLAGLMGVPVADFLETIATYNENVIAAQTGTTNADATDRGGFGKPNTQMTIAYIEVDNPEATHVVYGTANGPFFAVKMYPGALLSFGGVMADWRGRALRADGTYISNLYAIGEMSYRDMFLQTYAGGSAIALTITQGWIAGTDAARMLRGHGPIPSLVRGDTAGGWDEDFDPHNPMN